MVAFYLESDNDRNAKVLMLTHWQGQRVSSVHTEGLMHK